MTDSTDTASRSGRRGQGFPTVALADAVGLVTRAGDYGTTQSKEAFASHLGHQTTNSGAFMQKLAALRDFGLVSARGDEIAITELGQRLAFPHGGGPAGEDMREAFRVCAVFRSVYENARKGQALTLAGLGNQAVRQQGVSAKNRDAFVRSFVASATSAELAEPRGTDGVILTEASTAASPSDRADSSPSDSDAPGRPTVEGGPSRSHSEVDLRVPIAFSYGEIVLHLQAAHAPPAAAFAKFGELTSVARELAAIVDRQEADE